MANRRTFLKTTSAITVTALLAGCLDIFEEGVEADAEKARVNEEYLAETEYKLIDAEQEHVNEVYEVAGQEVDVDVTTWITTYAKEVDEFEEFDEDELEDAYEESIEILEQNNENVFGIISTPSESVLGQEINPIDSMDDEELIREFENELSDVNAEIVDIDYDGDIPVEVLDETEDMSFYTLQIEDDNGEYEIKVYVTEFENENDIIVAVGGHLAEFSHEEEIIGLTENIEHPVEPSQE